MNYNFISIEGNIGVGKTTLAVMLAEKLNSKLVLEKFIENPFLPKFYQNNKKYAFPLEMSFLSERYSQFNKEVFKQNLFNRSTISDYYVTKSLIFSKINLDPDEYLLTQRLFDIMYPQLPKPNLMVYLHADVKRLQYQINIRGREYEQHISDSYLLQIQEGYLNYLKHQQYFPVLVIDITNMDFVSNSNDFEKIQLMLDHKYSQGVHYL